MKERPTPYSKSYSVLESRLLRDSSRYSSMSSSDNRLISTRKRSQVSAMEGLVGLSTKHSRSNLQMLSPQSLFILGLTPPRMTDFFNIEIDFKCSYGVSSARICQHKILNEYVSAVSLYGFDKKTSGAILIECMT